MITFMSNIIESSASSCHYCQYCRIISFAGVCYKCNCCVNYYLCSTCIEIVEEKELHSPHHQFLRLKALPCSDHKEAHQLSIDCSERRHDDVCNRCKSDIFGFRYFCSSCCVSFCSQCQSMNNNSCSCDASYNLLKMMPPEKSLTQGPTRDDSSEIPSQSILPMPPESLPPPTLTDYGITVDTLKV